MNNPTVYFPKAWRLMDALDWLAQHDVPATEQWVCPTIDFGQPVMFWVTMPIDTEQTPHWQFERGHSDHRVFKAVAQ